MEMRLQREQTRGAKLMRSVHSALHRMGRSNQNRMRGVPFYSMDSDGHFRLNLDSDIAVHLSGRFPLTKVSVFVPCSLFSELKVILSILPRNIETFFHFLRYRKIDVAENSVTTRSRSTSERNSPQ